MTDSFFRAALSDPAAVVAALPSQARELAETIGLLPTLELLRRLGGLRVFIPAKLSAKLVVEVGCPDVAAKLVEAIGGSAIEPPSLASVQRLLRDNAIRADFDAGATPNELVARYRLTQRRLRTLLKASAATAPRSQPEP